MVQEMPALTFVRDENHDKDGEAHQQRRETSNGDQHAAQALGAEKACHHAYEEGERRD